MQSILKSGFVLITFCALVFSGRRRSFRVLDLEIIYGAHGVKSQDWYNEITHPNETRLGSVPGCPMSIDGIPWIYHRDTEKCFLAFHNGPCPPGQKLVLVQGTPFGICACNCFSECALRSYGKSCTIEGLKPFEGRYAFCDRHFVGEYGVIFDKQEGACYEKYVSRGSCKNNMVVSGYSGDSITCVPKCDFKNPEWHTLEKNGLCFLISTRVVNHGTSNILRHDICGRDERFSEILRKCVKKVIAVVG